MYPLQPFLDTLSDAGLLITIQDYDRIQMALNSGGEWTLTQLRDTLLVLLARDEAQRENFLLRFDEFFGSINQDENGIQKVDISRIRDEVIDLLEKCKNSEDEPKPGDEYSGVSPKPGDEYSRVSPKSDPVLSAGRINWQLWGAMFGGLAFLIISTIVIALYIPTITKPPEPAITQDPLPSFTVSPPGLDFGNLKFGDTVTRTIEIQNNTTNEALFETKLTSEHIKDFLPNATDTEKPIGAGERRKVTIRFQPGDASLGTRSAIYSIRGIDREVQVPLNGTVVEELPDKAIPPIIQVQETQYNRFYRDIPFISKTLEVSQDRAYSWLIAVILSIILLGIALTYALIVRQRVHVIEDKAAEYDIRGPRIFAYNTIGGTQSSLLKDATLDQITEAIGYFQSENVGSRLNVPASIHKTLLQGGMPSLKFYSRNQLRSVLILEDQYASSRSWNHIPDELQAGLNRRGISVKQGTFKDIPTKYIIDNEPQKIKEIEDQHDEYLLLIFIEDIREKSQEDKFTLDLLASWPLVIWFDFREPKFWGIQSQILKDHGIPLYPASEQGILQGLRTILTERTSTVSQFTQRTREPALIEPLMYTPGDFATNEGYQEYQNRLRLYIENLLGEALFWAQDCSMLQPMPLALIDKLRLRFYKRLSADHIGRLYKLPKTYTTDAGLRFDNEVLKILRHGFIESRVEGNQNAVLEYMLEHVEDTKPDQEASLAYLHWEYVCEHIRMELDSSTNLLRLSQLAKGPLGNRIRVDFKEYGLANQRGLIPLRYKPQSYAAQRRLAAIATQVPTPKIQTTNWYIIAGLISLALISLISALWLYINAPQVGPNFEIILKSKSLSYVRFDTQDNINSWKPLMGNILSWKTSNNQDSSSQEQSSFRLSSSSLGNIQSFATSSSSLDTNTPIHLLSGSVPGTSGRMVIYDHLTGQQKSLEIQDTKKTQIYVETASVTKPCIENKPAIQLEIERCIVDKLEGVEIAVLKKENPKVELPTWRQQLDTVDQQKLPQRFISIGLEIGSSADPQLRAWRSLLLQTGSVDLIYRINPDSRENIEKSIKSIRSDIEPLIGQSQLIWWTDGSPIAVLPIEQMATDFGRSIRLDGNKDRDWVNKLLNLFAANKSPEISEQQMRDALHLGQVDRPEQQIILLSNLQRLNIASSIEDSLYGHKSYVFSAAFNADGSRLVSSSFDATVRIWDVATGDLLTTIRAPYVNKATPQGFNQAIFSPDGQQIITAGRDYTIRIWNSKTGALLQTLEGHTGEVTSVSINANGGRLVSGSWDETVRIWDIRAAKLLYTLRGHTGIVSSVSMSLDGSRIASGSLDGTVRVWDAQTATHLHTLEGHKGRVNSVSISPDSSRVISGGEDQTIRIWDIQTGKLLFNPLHRQPDTIKSVSISPNGAYMASGSYDGTIAIWEMQTGTLLQILRGHTDHVQDLTFSPDSAYIASASDDGTMQMWTVQSGEHYRTFGNRTILYTAQLGPDNTRILTASSDGVMRILDAQTGNIITTIDNRYSVRSASFSPDGSRIVSASSDNSVRIWDQSGQMIRSLDGHTSWVWSANFSSDGKRIVSASQDGSIRVWDMQTGKELLHFTANNGSVYFANFSPDGKWIASVGSDQNAQLWDANTGQLLHSLKHKSMVWHAAFSSDSKQLLTASSDPGITIWDSQTGTQLKTLKAGALHVNYNSNDTRIISSDSDGTIRIWDVKAGDLIQTLTGHTSSVWNAQFSTDDTRIISSSADNTVRVWSVEPYQQLMVIPIVHQSAQRLIDDITKGK